MAIKYYDSLNVTGTTDSYFLGDVGIGTSTPSEKLEVKGNIKVIESGQTLDISVFHSDGNYAKLRGQGLFLSRATSYLAPEQDNFGSLAVGYNGARWGNVEINAATVKFENGSNEFMRITSTGKVGIGTTSPTTPLYVNAGSNNQKVAIFTGNNTDRGLEITTYQQSNHDAGVILDAVDPSHGTLKFQTSSSDAMTIDVNQNSTFAGDVLVEDNLYLTDAGTVRGKIQLNASDRDDLDIKVVSLGSNMKFFTVDTERMRIDASGNVGIGTTSPSAPLDVRRSDTSGVAAEFHNSVGYGININVESDGGVNTISSGTNQSLAFATNGGSNERMRISSSGALKLNEYTEGTLVSDASGNITVSSGGGAGGPFLPLAGGTLSGNLTIAHTTNPYLYLNDTNAGAGIFQQEGNTTRIGSDSNTQVVLVQNNATAVTIDTSKNVGIGTTSPAQKLQVHGGNINIQNADGAFLTFNNGDANIVANYNGSGRDLSFKTYNGTALAEKMRINKDGNVGIGTTAPGAKLQIGSATYAPNSNLGNNLLQIKSASGFAYLTIGNGDTANSTSYIGGASGLTTVGSVTDAGVLSEYMRIKNDGNVGIGTTAPSEKLHVKGNILVEDNDSTDTVAQIGNSGDDGWINLYANGTSTAFIGSNAVSYLNGGNVGIGTTSPSGPLHVKGSTDDVVVYIDTNNNAIGDTASIQFNDRAKVGWFESAVYLGDNGQNKDIKLKVNLGDIVSLTSNTERMRITSAGDVGIGTTSPSEKLDVNGTVNLTNLKIATAQGTDGQVLTSTGSGVAWEDAGGGSGTVTSITATAGALGGLTGGTITTSGSIAIDYDGSNNFILASGTQLTSADNDDILAIVDVGTSRQVKYISKEDFLEDQVTSVTTGEPSGADSVINIVSLTQAEYDAGTPVATTLYIIT